MTNSKNFKLPSDEELNTQELNISWPYIAAAAVFLAKRCEWFNNVRVSFFSFIYYKVQYRLILIAQSCAIRSAFEVI